MKSASIQTLTRSRAVRAFALLALGAGALAATGAARAGNVAWSVGISTPGVQVGLAGGAPVYVQPAPVYVQPAPVYVQPAPVYVQPRVGYYDPAPPVYGAATPDYPNVYYGPQPSAYYGAVAPVVYAPPVVAYRAAPVVRPLPPVYRPPYVRPVARPYANGYAHGYAHGHGGYRAAPVYGGPGGRPVPYR